MERLKNWQRNVGQKTLLILCLLMLGSFHAINLRHGQFSAPFAQWWGALRWSRISMASASGELFGFGFPFVADPAPPSEASKRPRKLDAANQWLSWVGLHLRAQVDESQPRWINYPYRGKRYYFLRDEIALQYKRHEQITAKSYVNITKVVSAAVTKAGGTLVITPMPTKTSIYRDRLPEWLPEQELWTPVETRDDTEDSYSVYAQALRGAPRSTVDVYELFARHHSRHPDDELYIPSNHEWTSLGIALTAMGVIKNLRERGWDLARPRLLSLDQKGELYDRGLLDILNLPPEFSRFYPQTRRREEVFGVNKVTKKEQGGRLIVFGTCFSNRLRDSNSFANTLAHALGRHEVINLGTEGGKTLPSFKKFLKRYKRFKPGDLVIWEFNVRETFSAQEQRQIRARLKAMRKKR